MKVHPVPSSLYLPWLIIPAAFLRGARTPVLCLLAFPFLALLALILLALGVGGRWRAAPVYPESGGCAQPCWQGLRPGESTLPGALRTLEANGMVVTIAQGRAEEVDFLNWEMHRAPSYSARASFRNGVLVQVELFPDEGEMTLRDSLAALGPPSYVSMCYGRASFGGYRESMFATVYFAGGAVEVVAAMPISSDWRLRPDMRVMQITYHPGPPDGENGPPSSASAWHGFGRAGYINTCR